MWRLLAAAGLVAGALVAGSGVAAEKGRKVHLVATNWAPYYHANLPQQGVVSALTRAAFGRTAYRVAIDFKPFARAMGEAKAGEYDGLMGAWHNAERDRVFAYSEPVIETRNVLVAWRDSVDIRRYDDLRELTGYSIGVGRGWAYDPAFDQADFLDKEVAPDHLTNLRKLFNGRLDMMAVEERVFFHALKKRPHFTPEAVGVLEPPLSETPIYNILREELADSDAILAAFNDGLAAIRADGTYNAITRELDWRR